MGEIVLRLDEREAETLYQHLEPMRELRDLHTQLCLSMRTHELDQKRVLKLDLATAARLQRTLTEVWPGSSVLDKLEEAKKYKPPEKEMSGRR